ncbi:MAG: glycosyltransferase family 4 protein, partial [Bacteroidales bacterium]|nr:glycosyltransferase family 4 protein [Bacteroidales bacterium]
IEKPKFVSKIYRILLNYYADHIVFNSFATKQSWAKTSESLDIKSSVIYNGILKPNTIEAKLDVLQINQNHAIRSNHLVIGLVGRISRWKGQILLLNAFEILQKKYPKLILLYLGSPPPNQEFFLENLEKEVESKNLKNSVRIIPYTENIWDYWKRIDIAVVPSTEPEPFGLVAVEAMLSAKPVVVAGHGGLTEIIEHEKTGILFKPNDVISLTEQLETLIQDPEKRKRLGENGKLFAESRFTNQTYVESFFNLYEKLLTNE